jgi:AcrR family transcriptional regulator
MSETNPRIASVLDAASDLDSGSVPDGPGPHDAPAEDALLEAGAPPSDELSRRARKKAATRRALSDAALSLFAEVGFDETTVEAIADLVDVTPRTFHRHFARKEDALFADAMERVQQLRDALAERPPDEPVLDSLLAGISAVLVPLAARRDREARRAAVLSGNLVLQAANLRYLDEWSAVLAEHVAAREGCEPSDPWPRLVARCAVAAAASARAAWIDRDGDLPTLLVEAFAMLGRVAELAEDAATRASERAR